MFDLYFAGTRFVDGDKYDKVIDLIINNNYNKLLSYINDIKEIPFFIEKKKNGWKGKIIIDSGAFSIHRSGKSADVEKYIEWLNNNHEYLDLYIQLDDIPGKWGRAPTSEEVKSSPSKTWNNYLYMVSKLKEPKKLMPVFHQGEDFKWLKNILEYKNSEGEYIDYICISSNKQLSANIRYEWYKKCFEIIENSSNPNVKVHSLGTQSKNHCEKIPFTSVDATSWILSAVNGNIFTDYGSICVSDRHINDFKNIKNNISFEVFKKYIEDKGFNFEALSESIGERVIWNCMYLGEWAKQMKYNGPESFSKNWLF